MKNSRQYSRNFKQLLDDVFGMSRIIEAEVGPGYQPKPKAEVDNPYRDSNILDITKTEPNNCFITH